jgi:hypothetical protein
MNLGSKNKLVGAVILATSAVASAACSSSSGAATPTCEQATPRLYGLSCMLVVDGNDLTESEALTACNQLQSDVDAGTCPCGSDLSATLSCWDTETACGNCENQLAALEACAKGCPGSN